MSSVKGSKQLKMKVVPDRPRLQLAVRISAVCCLLVVAVAAWYAGFTKGVDINGDARIQRADLLALTERLQNEINTLEAQLLFSEQANIVDRQSLEQVQATLVSQRETIRRLEQDLSLYRQVMSPETEQGFSVGDVEIIPVEGVPGNFFLQVELLQKGTESSDDALLTGHLDFSIAGRMDRQEMVVTAADLAVDPEALGFGFRFFQNLEFIFVLPDGFEPEQIHMEAALSDSNEIISRTVDWQLSQQVDGN